MRLARVEQADDGSVALHLHVEAEYATMGDLEKAMRKEPECWPAGTKWTLVAERPILTVIKTESYAIQPVDMEA